MRMIDRGFRLAPPPGCIEPVYHLMIQCWWVLDQNGIDHYAQLLILR